MGTALFPNVKEGHLSRADGSRVLLEASRMDAFIAALRDAGYSVIGPRIGQAAVVYGEVSAAADLPAGVEDEQAGGHYRLKRRDDGALFGYSVAPQGWKRWLYPPRQTLFSATRAGGGFRVSKGDEVAGRYAFLGVRACELAAIKIQDRVFDNGDFKEPGYLTRRRDALVVAVACGRSCGTCFCVSMGGGPKPGDGFDLMLTELTGPGRHVFVVESGSEKGAAILAGLALPVASAEDVAAADEAPREAARQQTKAMDPQARDILARNREHPRWDDVAKRCLTCGNCTMVCPTCFCTTVDDVTDLGGTRTERVRSWDSCFTLDFSYIHGGSVRNEGSSRYRQWITHKLSSWHDQFGTSGCVGCGRCVTWCPVGIDITEEVGAIRASEEGR
ncbi:MAG: 4Fe-4S dicluster domain-containing protein [Alphaproteobacteria bacterium]|nr:4Fe-4S dicluster domain-containing protein [Alphaproteobacteria bacterium]